MEKLHIQAVEILNKFDNDIVDIIRNNNTLIDPKTDSTKLMLHNSDFLQFDWSEASVLFANSTCFSSDLMFQLAKKASETLRKGAIFITFTKKLPDLGENWTIKTGFRRLMSWGIATIYIHIKIN